MLNVLMSHLQTVALAIEFDLRWPACLAGMFAVSDATSSLSDAVVSLDCVLPAAAAGSGAACLWARLSRLARHSFSVGRGALLVRSGAGWFLSAARCRA